MSTILHGTASPLLRKLSNFASSRNELQNMIYARAAVGIALLACMWSCGNPANTSETRDVLRRGLGGEPSTLDPAAAVDNFSYEVMQDLYEGLTTESPTGEVIPGVASSWIVDATGTHYTFQIRSDARWSDGKPLRAQDFVSGWRRVVDPKQGSPVADNLRLIKGAASIIRGKSPLTSLGVYAVSDNVLAVDLEQPAPYLPQLLTHAAAYPIYSDAIARSHDPNTWVSNGPYVLSRWSPGTTVELKKNESYWDHAKVHIPRVEFQVVPDENAQFARYRAGQLDLTDTIPASAIAALRRDHSTELLIAPFLATAYYGLNLSNPPLASNVKLRQAIAMAIDRKQLVASLGFGQASAYGFVPPGTWNYSPRSWKWKDLTDVERISEAKRLYSEAGYSIHKPLHLRLLFNANPVIRNTAIILAGMWKETLGIESELTEEEYRVFLQSRHDKTRWDVARLGFGADYNDAGNFLDIFREHSANNDVGYINPSLDTVLDEASNTADPEYRRTLLETAEQMILEDYPVVPLYFFVSKRLVKPFVHGIRTNPLNHIRSKALTLDRN
jgi:oligopeptide transport system substrate-binding protein